VEEKEAGVVWSDEVEEEELCSPLVEAVVGVAVLDAELLNESE